MLLRGGFEREIVRAIELAWWAGVPDVYDETAPVVCLWGWDGCRLDSQLIYLDDIPSHQVIDDRLTDAIAEMHASDADRRLLTAELAGTAGTAAGLCGQCRDVCDYCQSPSG